MGGGVRIKKVGRTGGEGVIGVERCVRKENGSIADVERVY